MTYFKPYMSVAQRSYEEGFAQYMALVRGVPEEKTENPEYRKKSWVDHRERCRLTDKLCIGAGRNQWDPKRVLGCLREVDIREVTIIPFGELLASGITGSQLHMNQLTLVPLCDTCNLLWYGSYHHWTVKTMWYRAVMKQDRVAEAYARAHMEAAAQLLRELMSEKMNQFQTWYYAERDKVISIRKHRGEDMTNFPPGYHLTYTDITQIGDGILTFYLYPNESV
jgi:hypothetical protein